MSIKLTLRKRNIGLKTIKTLNCPCKEGTAKVELAGVVAGVGWWWLEVAGGGGESFYFSSNLERRERDQNHQLKFSAHLIRKLG